MSKISSLNENIENITNSQISSNQEKLHKIFYFSDQKINPPKLIEADVISNEPMTKCGCNSSCINRNNKLFKSFINSKKIKNKELSLLYLINTFNKSYSNESNKKNNIIIDLPKISKKLFSKSHIRYNSSNNLDYQSFQKNVHISKCGGGIVNNFFSNIYSGGEIPNCTFSPNKNRKSKPSFYSGNKLSNYLISPFSNRNYKFERLFSNNVSSSHLNNESNFDIKEQNEGDYSVVENKICSSSLLANIIMNNEYDANEENKK